MAIALNGITILCKEIAEEGYSHAEKLHGFIADVVKDAGIEFSDLSAIAVSQGPGSYTGLRIGVSAAKGLSYGLNIPLIAIDTLQSLATQVSISEGLIVPMLDARRMEVYSAVFSNTFEKVRAIEAEIIDENSFQNWSGPVYFIGDCAEKCQAVLTNDNFVFLEQYKYPSANQMSQLSFEKFRNSDFVDVAYFEPYYLKDFLITTPKVKQ